MQTSSRPWLVVGLLLLVLGAVVWGFLRLLAPEPGTWRSVGIVEAVAQDFVVIRHERIPGFMEAHSMALFAASRTHLDGVAPGQRARFVFKPSANADVHILIRVERRR